MSRLAAAYSRALFDAGRAAERGAEARYGALLAAFAVTAREEPLRGFLRAPQVPRDEKKRLFAETFTDPGDGIFLSFLELLAEKGRLSLLPEIALDYEGLLLAQNNTLRATVESAFPLDGETLARIVETFRERTGASELRAEARVVPELLGGVRVLIGSEIYDGTVRSGLDRLRAALKNRETQHVD